MKTVLKFLPIILIILIVPCLCILFISFGSFHSSNPLESLILLAFIFLATEISLCTYYIALKLKKLQSELRS